MSDRSSVLNTALAGRYRIERELGAGGMATVYLAHDARHDRRVAVKVLRPELSAILGAERFVAEIRTTANLQHPHILSLFESGDAAGLVYYVMPYIDGESLRDRINRDRQLPVDEAIRIAREVADALQYAHERGIVHRDIKPENILLHGGHAVVADFGIALAASRSEGSTRMTETGMSLGTPQYMSPEQAMGEREITPRADIYALGCVLYEMLSGEPPFMGASAQAIVARVLTEEPRSLTQQRKTIPPHVDLAVQTSLSKLPADRFASAREFSEALTDPGFTASRMSATVSRPSARRRVAWLPWAVTAVAAIAAAAGWLRPDSQPAVIRERTVLWSYAIPRGGVALLLAISPDGNTIVYTDSINGPPQLYVKRRETLSATPLPGTERGVRPVFSPDGDSIVFATAGKVKRMALSGGPAVLVADDANPTIPALAWLDDGTILYNLQSYSLQAVRPNGESREVVDPGVLRRGVIDVTALPDGRGALITTCSSGCQSSDVRVLDLRSGEIRLLADEALKGWYVGSGDIVIARRDGAIVKAGFNVRTLALEGEPVPVLDGVRTGGPGADIALSANGTLMYVAGSATGTGNHVEPVWVSRAGVITPVDTGWSFPTMAAAGISLSPDGRRLAVVQRTVQNQDVWIRDLLTGAFTRLTFVGENNRPAWTADGRSVVYTSRGRENQDNDDLFVRLADGSGSERLFYDGEFPVVETEPTRDTTQFVIRMVISATSRDIVLLTRRGDSTAITPLLTESYSESQPALSPDGRWLAYSSNESGALEVYVRPFPDVNRGRWRVSRNGGAEPLWSHSGRELFYRDGRAMLMAAQVNTGESFTIGEQRALFSTTGLAVATSNRTFALMPDDSRFLFLRLKDPFVTEEGTTQVIRVDNWLTELQARK